MIPDYSELLTTTKEYGNVVQSQYGLTHEQLALQVFSPSGEMLRRDNINYSIGYIETMQIIGGVFNHHALTALAPNSALQLFTIQMAYGPRVVLQMERVIEKMQGDPETRQAIVFIGKPEDGPTNFQTCTTTIQFLVRKGVVHGIVGMRSWDLVKGIVYDLMMFHGLVQVVAHCLDLQAGPVIVQAGSAHVYEKDLERQAKPSSRCFRLRSDLPRDFKQIRDLAQEVTIDALNVKLGYELQNETKHWKKAEGMKHMVPIGLVEEILIV